MSYNGYKNWETWLFMVHFGDYLFESLKEQKEYDDDFNYKTVYNTVESLINELNEGINNVPVGGAFLNDLVSASLGEVDIKEVADLIFEDFKD